MPNEFNHLPPPPASPRPRNPQKYIGRKERTLERDVSKKNQYPGTDFARPRSLGILWYPGNFFVRSITPHAAAAAQSSRRIESTKISSNIVTAYEGHTRRGRGRGKGLIARIMEWGGRVMLQHGLDTTSSLYDSKTFTCRSTAHPHETLIGLISH